MKPKDFAEAYFDVAFRPVRLWYRGRPYDIDFNRCANPFCKWYGLPQGELPKGQRRGYGRSRYGSSGSEIESLFGDDQYPPPYLKAQFKDLPEPTDPSLTCHDEEILTPGGVVDTTDSAVLLSNWGLAEEIARLATHDALAEVKRESDYV